MGKLKQDKQDYKAEAEYTWPSITLNDGLCDSLTVSPLKN